MIAAHAPQMLGGAIADLENLISKVPQYLDDVVKIVDKAGPYISTVAKIAEDPALPLIMARIEKLKAIEDAAAAKAKGIPAVPGVAPPSTPGVGLVHYVRPLDAVITWRQHPWLPWALGIGGAVVLVGLGVVVGRVTKKTGGRR